MSFYPAPTRVTPAIKNARPRKEEDLPLKPVESQAPILPQSATVYEARPTAPLFSVTDPVPPDPGPEPPPWTATAEVWANWVRTDNTRRDYNRLIEARDKADAYALENDLRGTF